MKDIAPTSFDTNELLQIEANASIRDHVFQPAHFVWWLDANGLLVCVCDEAASLVGASPSILIGRPDAEYFKSPTFDTIRELECQVLKSGQPILHSLTRKIVRSPLEATEYGDYGLYWLVSILPWFDPLHGSSPCGIVRIARDATDAVTAAANAFDETYSQLLFEVSHHSLLNTYDRRPSEATLEYTHDLNGTFLSMNEAGLKTFGFSQSTLKDVNILDIVSDRHKRQLKKSLKKRFADIVPNMPVIWRTRKHDGTPMWVEIRAERQSTQDGEIVHGVGWPLSLSSLEELHRHSRVVQGGRIASWDRELSSDRFFVSAEWKRLLGISTAGTVTFHQFVERLHPDDRVRVRKAFSDHAMNHRDFYDTRYRIRHNDGNYRWMHAVGQITEAIGGTRYISGHNIDITGEMGDARTLMDREALFRAIVDSDPAMIFMKNKASDFAFTNSALCRFYRTSPEEAFGKTDEWFYRNVPQTDDVLRQLELFRRLDEETLRSKNGSTAETIEFIVPPGGQHKDGRWFSTVKIHVDLDGEPYVVGISSDVTRLYLEKDMYETLLELSPAAMFIKDAKGKYLMANRRFAAFLGAESKEQVCGRRARTFLSASSAENAESSDNYCMAGHVEDSVRRVVELISGEKKQALGSKKAVRVLDEKGEFQVRLIGCDIDESETRDHTYVELLDSLLTSLKHDYVCRFLGIIESELEECAISQNLNGNGERWKRMLRYSQDFIKRLQWLGPRPESFANTTDDGITYEPCSISESISEACDLADMLEGTPACDQSRVDSRIMVACDRTLLSNVVFNFVNNAKRFTPGTKKGQENIIVVAEYISCNQERRVRVSIDDGGEGLKPGVDPSLFFEKGRAFDPGERSVKGSGTGLYFNKIIIENILHGSVETPCKSERGGAIFSFTIPCCNEL